MSSSRHDLPASPDGPPDGRSPAARAAQWASRIMTVSLEMVLPGLAGYWVDLQLGTKVVFMLLGFAVGMYTAMKHLMHFVKHSDRTKTRAAKTKENRP